MSRKLRKVGVFVSWYLLTFFATTYFVLGQEFANPVQQKSIIDLLNVILATAVYVLTPVIVLMIVYTGFLFVQAQGNATKLTVAKTSLVWSVIGATIVLSAAGIKLLLENTMNNIVG